MSEKPITIVSGLPRSGTSMMMQMLEAGGMEVLRDGIREADDDNPKGYYEFERVKQVARDQAWLDEARGKVVKIISGLLQQLPAGYSYKIVFMRRDMNEILASQKVMLRRRNQPTDSISDQQMAALFDNHLKEIEKWLSGQPNMSVLYIDYNETMRNPVEQVKRINDFLGYGLDSQKMANVADAGLYRERHARPAGTGSPR